jgi:hypothetical protein
MKRASAHTDLAAVFIFLLDGSRSCSKRGDAPRELVTSLWQIFWGDWQFKSVTALSTAPLAKRYS